MNDSRIEVPIEMQAELHEQATPQLIESEEGEFELYTDESPFRLSLRITNFESEAEYNKFIRNCEKHVRGSIEYKLWREYIIDVLQMQKCMITNERMDQCKVEIHHHVPSLYTMVKAIINEKIENDEPFSTFDISLKTIEMHFQNKVGYVNLIQSMHQKFHNGHLAIPKMSIHGNYQGFLNEYSKYIDDDELDVIQQRLSIDETNCGWSRDHYPSDD